MLTATPIKDIISRQRKFFATGKTKEVNFRREQLEKLKAAIKKAIELFSMLFMPISISQNLKVILS